MVNIAITAGRFSSSERILLHWAYQFFGPHVVEDPLGVLTVMATLHDSQQQLGRVVLEEGKKHKAHKGHTADLKYENTTSQMTSRRFIPPISILASLYQSRLGHSQINVSNTDSW